MKKALAMILAAVLALTAAACGTDTKESAAETAAAESTKAETAAAETTEAETAEEETAAAETTAADTTPAEAASEETAEAAEKTVIRLGGLKGPVSMGMVKMLDDAESGLTENSYDFTMAGAVDELTPAFLKGDLDILAVPANLGAVLYANSDGAIEMCAIDTLGVIYIVEKGSTDIQTIEDLKGKTILALGKGTTTEYALSYLLSQHGLDIETDVTIEWKSESTEVVAQMATMDTAVAMIPQPFVTVAETQIPDLTVALDLTAEWDALNNGSQFLTAALLVRRDFAEEHPEAVAAFLRDYDASQAWVNANVTEAAALIEKYDIVTAAIAEKALPYCNIVCITGQEMVEATKGYFQVLYDQNPAALGGSMPGDDFFWTE